MTRTGNLRYRQYRVLFPDGSFVELWAYSPALAIDQARRNREFETAEHRARRFLSHSDVELLGQLPQA